jgi:hypothetical protein
VGKFDKGTCTARLLLLGCALGSALSLPAQAGDGQIVILRDVHPRMATRAPLVPDPHPTAINANPSAAVLRQTGELNDGDFANVSSGAGISGMIVPQTNTLGGNLSPQNTLPNMASGRGNGGGSGGGIANMVNSSVQQGLGALKVLGGK